jgi:hypothetical protein
VGGVVRDTNYREETMSESQGITITNACYACYILNELCMDCEDNRLTREAIMAHEIVDDGSDIYRYAPMYTSLTKIDTPESGHEWVGSTTRVEPYFVWATQTWEDTREEFLPPITVITDRLFELNMEMPPNSMVCQTCHYTCNKHAACPNCN